jgi:hypothetical protein
MLMSGASRDRHPVAYPGRVVSPFCAITFNI